ncbi:S-layer homology domain-containing protein [Candidatus Peregrinibacteria bacterium]|nr:S-layer homology domain-containing protein [Candidatus Peregrinibacteria bacterium]MBT4056508.1 S-layer homology domain-containing protein [Candidatus Peregrinibacteria bacterium]
MKKIFGIVVSLVLLFSLSTQSVFAGVFSDVPEDHGNYQAIEFLKNNGYINGYPDNTFKPDSAINRAEAVTILVSAADLDLSTTEIVLFGDVPSEQWFFPYVMTAHDNGIVSGDKDGRFRPSDTITLAEALRMIGEALNVELPAVAANSNVFKDVPGDQWYSKYAAYAKDKNILLMDDNGKVHPDTSLTRAGFAEIMYRFVYVRDHSNEAYPLDFDWPTYVSDVLPFKMKYPLDYEILRYDNKKLSEVTFWRPDRRFNQFSPERTHPNTAKFVVTLDHNVDGVGKAGYFDNIKNAFGGWGMSEFDLGGFDALRIASPAVVDWYIYLDKGDFAGKVLVVYTYNGNGPISEQLRKFLNTMLESFEFNDLKLSDDDNYASVRSEILENVLVERKGAKMLELLPDGVIIETDTIGVGTGPIDYYYSAEFDITLKYEREGDVLLDTRDGLTTAF